MTMFFSKVQVCISVDDTIKEAEAGFCEICIWSLLVSLVLHQEAAWSLIAGHGNPGQWKQTDELSLNYQWRCPREGLLNEAGCELFLLNVSQAFEKRSCLQMWSVGRKRLRWRPGLLSIAVAHEKAVMRLMHDVLLMWRALFSHFCPFCSSTRMFFFTLKRKAFRRLSLRFDNLNLQLGRLASFHELPCLMH